MECFVYSYKDQSERTNKADDKITLFTMTTSTERRAMYVRLKKNFKSSVAVSKRHTC